MATYVVEAAIITQIRVEAETPEEAIIRARDNALMLGETAQETLPVLQVFVGNMEHKDNRER